MADLEKIKQQGRTKIVEFKKPDLDEDAVVKQMVEILRADGEEVTEEDVRRMLLEIPPETGSAAYDAELNAIDVNFEDLPEEKDDDGVEQGKHDEL